jgi:hypothetical protein
MQTHEGIEHEQARLQVGDGVVEASAVGREIQSHGGTSLAIQGGGYNSSS